MITYDKAADNMTCSCGSGKERPMPLQLENVREYDAAAMDLARRGLKGAIGDPLPNLMSGATVDAINEDPEAFEQHVRMCAYALAMERKDQ
jgi:hypothetical protein